MAILTAGPSANVVRNHFLAGVSDRTFTQVATRPSVDELVSAGPQAIEIRSDSMTKALQQLSLIRLALESGLSGVSELRLPLFLQGSAGLASYLECVGRVIQLAGPTVLHISCDYDLSCGQEVDLGLFETIICAVLAAYGSPGMLCLSVHSNFFFHVRNCAGVFVRLVELLLEACAETTTVSIDVGNFRAEDDAARMFDVLAERLRCKDSTRYKRLLRLRIDGLRSVESDLQEFAALAESSLIVFDCEVVSWLRCPVVVPYVTVGSVPPDACKKLINGLTAPESCVRGLIVGYIRDAEWFAERISVSKLEELSLVDNPNDALSLRTLAIGLAQCHSLRVVSFVMRSNVFDVQDANSSVMTMATLESLRVLHIITYARFSLETAAKQALCAHETLESFRVGNDPIDQDVRRRLNANQARTSMALVATLLQGFAGVCEIHRVDIHIIRLIGAQTELLYPTRG